jgi:hypothetical protein
MKLVSSVGVSAITHVNPHADTLPHNTANGGTLAVFELEQNQVSCEGA